MSIEREETLRIQKTSVRSESEVWILNGYFYKKMTDNELDAYKHLEWYSVNLKKEAKISTPQFLGLISDEELKLLKQIYQEVGRPVSENLYKISSLKSISYKDIEEKFGYGLGYTRADFDNVFDSLKKMRRIMSQVELKYPEDYESSALQLVEKSKKTIDIYLNVGDNYLLPIVRKSQSFLSGTDQQTAHRDLNWSNMGLVTSLDGKWSLEIADWGSLGFAYAGYDEGRLFTRLSLNPELQKVYLNCLHAFINRNLEATDTKKFLVSFWQTVVIRSHREIALALQGRYKNPVSFKYGSSTEKNDKRTEFYRNFVESHKNIIKKGIDNLRILLS